MQRDESSVAVKVTVQFSSANGESAIVVSSEPQVQGLNRKAWDLVNTGKLKAKDGVSSAAEIEFNDEKGTINYREKLDNVDCDPIAFTGLRQAVRQCHEALIQNLKAVDRLNVTAEIERLANMVLDQPELAVRIEQLAVISSSEADYDYVCPNCASPECPAVFFAGLVGSGAVIKSFALVVDENASFPQDLRPLIFNRLAERARAAVALRVPELFAQRDRQLAEEHEAMRLTEARSSELLSQLRRRMEEVESAITSANDRSAQRISAKAAKLLRTSEALATQFEGVDMKYGKVIFEQSASPASEPVGATA